MKKGGYLFIPKGVQKGYFGLVTKEALKKFQKAKGITPTGTFGPKTRSLYNTENRMERSMKPVSLGSQNKENTQDNQRSETNQEGTKNSSAPTPFQVGESELRASGTIRAEERIQQGSSGGDNQVSKIPATIPPKEAVAICDPKQEGDSCSFTAPDSRSVIGTCEEVQETLACVPGGN